MPDRIEKLRQAVTELEEQLHSGQPLDQATRQLLQEAATEIQTALNQEDPTRMERQSIADRLRKAVQSFEADHPNLAVIVNRTIDILAQMGI